MPCWAFLFIFSPSDIYFPQGEESFYQLVWGQMIKESGTLVSLRTKNKYAGEMGALALNNAQVLFAWVCQCLRGLVEEELTSWPWKQDIRCCVHVQRWDVPTSTYSNRMSSNPVDDVSSWRQQNCFTNRRVIRPSGDSFVFCLFVCFYLKCFTGTEKLRMESHTHQNVANFMLTQIIPLSHV